ncbi:translocation/assembly module TamB domain-containing protein [Flavobacterium rakeshii]|uniref:translocation/assembly module TamB domain-containing protein n=1 Tax=Flavobacterium rakeshii TaxID=1038845 RepID=UPI002E7C5356|nr:translocation/assembly module TamB domain-containing protein [Flavobacterium rakeshii]MEE1899301.1 translocation/assembly module TamB domain-containing protein [Flavobacterium rakeshii]
MKEQHKKYLRKGIKIILWIIGSLIGLFLLIVLLIQIPYFQNIIKDKAVTYLEKKIGTDVDVNKIEIGLPKKVILEGVYFEDQQGDTLLAGEKLAVDVSLFKLLKNELEINSVNLQGIVANVSRDKDSVFNFDYIINAFVTDEPKDTTAAPMKISVRDIKLDRIRVTFKDDISTNDISANLTHFDTEFKKFDLDEMDFDIPEINLDGLKLTLTQGSVEKVLSDTQNTINKTTELSNLKLKLKDINIANIDVGYLNNDSKLDTKLTLNNLITKVNDIDLNKQNIDLDNLEINGLRGELVLGKTIQNTTTDNETTSSNDWKFRLNETAIKDVNFRFDDNNSARVAKGIDYKHLDISNFNLEAKKLSYATDSIAGNIQSFTVKDKSGVNLEKLTTNFTYTNKGASLTHLYLKTPQTEVKDKIIVSYPSLESLSDNIGQMAVDADIKGSHIGFKDILLFVPTLADTNPFKSDPNGIMYVNSTVNGRVNNLSIPNLEIRGVGNTIIAASGKITGLPDIEKAYFDMDVREFTSTANDIVLFLPEGTLPSNIQLPKELAAKAKFKGTLENFDADFNLSSTYGKANVKAAFDRRNKDAEVYDADAELTDFDLGRLLKNDSIGKLSLKATVKGKGLNMQTASAEVDANVIAAEYNSYLYKDLKVKGTVNNGKFDATATMKDPNLDFEVVANGGFDGNYPNGTIKINADLIDLDKLNLHAGPLKMRGNLDAYITDSNPANLNGKVNLYDFMVVTPTEEIVLDSVKLFAVSSPEKDSIRLSSQIVDASIVGKYNPAELANAITNTVSKYYDINSGEPKKVSEEQNFDLKLRIDNDPIITKLIPEITRIEPVELTASYRSGIDSLSVKGSIPRLVYGSNTISGGTIDISTQKDSLTYNIVIDEVQNERFIVPHTSITGRLKNDTLTYHIQVLDNKDEKHYLVSGELRAQGDNTEISLYPEGLRLNYNLWDVNPKNVMRFGKDGIYANLCEISNENSTIKIQSKEDVPNAPLNVELDNFKIETITNMIQKEELKLSGTLNGDAELRDITTNPVFVSNLSIDNFAISKDTIGDIKIKVDNTVTNVYNADVNITGNGNEVNLDGTYTSTSKSFDLNLDMEKLNMTGVQAFTFGSLKDGNGYLSGNFKVTGTTAKPIVNGTLDFNDVGFRVTQLNSYFNSMNDNITLNDNAITFNDFSIEDEDKNLMILNGKITTTDYTDYNFGMTIDAENFKAVNSTEKDNDFYYGTLYFDTHLNIKGTLETPVIDGNINIDENTDFTVVLPQSDPGIADREGVVEFVDEDNAALKQRLKIEETVNQSDVLGMDVSVAIQVNKEAELNMIIDKGNGDYLELKGDAKLNGGIDPSGKTTLTGRYEFNDGAYRMSFNFLKRKFDIQKNSYILWTGEPTEATIDITAIYEVEAAPIDLLGDELATASSSIRNTYKQKIPFQTVLKMQGELLKPELSFDIILPDGNYGVSSDIINNTKTKLAQLRQQSSDLNKQVFALLLLNHFINENPFSSEAGTSTEAIARQSVSKLLSQQLNNIAGDLINGFELNFDLESTEDYTTGQRENRTDLNVGVSKELLNDRLKVTVGSSFGLEGPQQANEETTNIAGDVSLDYQLTKDGRYMVRAYRKDEYQVAVQGQVVETGVAFIITMDYNKFRELFHRTEEEKEIKRREKELRERQKQEEKAQEEREKREARDKRASKKENNE